MRMVLIQRYVHHLLTGSEGSYGRVTISSPTASSSCPCCAKLRRRLHVEIIRMSWPFHFEPCSKNCHAANVCLGIFDCLQYRPVDGVKSNGRVEDVA